MLVLLRLNIGWHFFSEGVKHYSDPQWTSEPVLRSAKGPLAPMYQAYLPDFHGFSRLLHQETNPEESHAVQAWVDEVQQDWDSYRQKFSSHFGLDEAQQKRALAVMQDYQAKIREWATDNKDALVTHVHEWKRKEATRELPASDTPFQKKRVAEKQAALAGEANGWQSELKKVERDYENALTSLLDANQRTRPQLSHAAAAPIRQVDTMMTYGILLIGLLLILGLFTRTAALAGAAFLLSVVMTQPFWVSETQPTFNQFVEMFALLTLATTQVGRWAGLDFFLAHWISGSKGKSDVPQS